MSKISNTASYPTVTPADGDLLIGTDVNDNDATKTFTIGSINALTPADTLSEVLTAGNTATNNIVLTGDISCTNLTSTTAISGATITATTSVTTPFIATTAKNLLSGSIPIKFDSLSAYRDDAAAGTAGLVTGDIYQTDATNPTLGAGVLMVKQ
jgi:hypothetical protein